MAGTTAVASVAGWPDDVVEVMIPGVDGRPDQPALFWQAPESEPAPLLVGLHTWSNTHRQRSSQPYQQWCRQEGWHFIHPNFGGRNRTPESMGSDHAVAEVVRAVEWARSQANVDASRIYLVGVSGGGHMALLMAGRHPEIWAGVSAWCPISDIAQWHADCRATPRYSRYADDIESALGGDPWTEPSLMAAALRRSPVTWLKNAAEIPVDIQAGIHDGRRGSVPFRHSLVAYNAIVPPDAAIPDAIVERFYKTSTPPAGTTPAEDSLYDRWQPQFRMQHGNTRITIFEGGHEIVQVVALNWLAQQRRGQPASWEIPNPKPLETAPGSTRSGR